MPDLYWRIGEALAAFVVGGGLTGIVALLERRRSERSADIHRDVLRVAQQIDVELTKLRHDLGASRVVLLKLSNGGGVPTPGSVRYSTVLYESTGDLAPVMLRWQERPTDAGYSRMAADLIDAGRIKVVLPENADHVRALASQSSPPTVVHVAAGQLADLYRQDGVLLSEVVLVGRNKTALYYMSVNYTEAPAVPVAVRRALELAVADAVRPSVNAFPAN